VNPIGGKSLIFFARSQLHPNFPSQKAGIDVQSIKGRFGELAHRVHSDPSPANSVNANEVNPAN
jgi:hypothetical protein